MNSSGVVVRDNLKTAVLKNVITVTLCIAINYINATLVYTFIRHQIFKMTSRYVLYIHLVINDMSLLTVLTLVQVLSYIMYSLNVWLCIALLFIASIANINNPLTLAVMSFECYIAVCFPLRHAQICTVRKTCIVITFVWFVSALGFLPDLFVALATEHLGFLNSRVFCLRQSIFRSPILIKKDTIFKAVLLVIVCVILIYTYFNILFTAKSASAHAKKARNTVLLHSFQLILSMLTYLYNPVCMGLVYFFPRSAPDIFFTVAIIVNVMPRLVSPLVYGIRDKEFRKYLKRYFRCQKSTSMVANKDRKIKH